MTVKKIRIKIFVDSGATFNAVSPEIIQKIGIKFIIIEKKQASLLRNVLVSDIIYSTEILEIEINNYYFKKIFDIFSDLDRNIILNIFWFRRNNPPIN